MASAISDPARAATVTTARRLAAAFVLYGLVATAFLAINMPPFQNLDETFHFLRAAQIAEAELVGTRFETMGADRVKHLTAGGLVDPATVQAWLPFFVLNQNPEARATRANWTAQLHWTNERMMLAFPSTVIYPPQFYAPAGFAVLVGRATRMTVVQTLFTARLLTGSVAVAVAAAAIACAGGAAVWLFAVLTLPMSLALIATPSQDALLLACSALVGALLVRALRCSGDRSGKVLAELVVTLVLVATARPPYGALAVLPLAVTTVPLRSRVLAAATIVTSVLVWSGIAAATLTNFAAYRGADPAAQIETLRSDPLRVLPIAWATVSQHWQLYLDGFIGRLGSETIELPLAYHTAAWTMLTVAAVAAMLGLRGQRINGRSHLVIAVGLLLSIAGMFASEYIGWTVPGGATIEGMQGRYFLPLALAGAALLPALGGTRLARLHDALVLVVAAFPVVSLAVVMRAVELRYYLG